MQEVSTARFVNIGERTNVTGSARFKKLVMAGDYATACGKGIGETAGCEPRVTLRQPGISLTTYEAGVETFYWTDSGFRTTTLSD